MSNLINIDVVNNVREVNVSVSNNSNNINIDVVEVVRNINIEVNEIGMRGATGEGIPPGGDYGQLLAKKTHEDYDTEWITIDKSSVGLSNVDNTSDLDKPVSNDTQSALDLKAPVDNPSFTGDVFADSYTVNNYTGNRLLLDSGNLLEPNLQNDTRFLASTSLGEPNGNPPVWELITKSTVGLDNVDNTSDVDKPISTATQNALDLKVDNNTIIENNLVYADTNNSIREFKNNQESSLLFLASSNGSLPSWQPVPVSGSLVYYYSNTASDVVGYYKQQIDPIPNLEVIQNINVVDGQLLSSWITEPNNPALTSIQAGQYACHIHIAKVSGTKLSQIRAEIWETNELGVDIGKIASLGASSVISGINAEYIVADSILEYTLASAKSRISTKLYAVITGGGSNPHLNIYIGDGSDSRTDFPSPSISASNFLPYTGAVKNVDLGVNSISANIFNGDSVTQSQGDNSNKIATTSYVDNGLNFKIDNSFETISKNLKSNNYTFNYTGDVLLNIVYDTLNGNVTKTFNYTGDKLTSIVLSGATPSGISLAKTFIYSGNTLTNITYS